MPPSAAMNSRRLMHPPQANIGRHPMYDAHMTEV
jgi:hypothetical protein